MKLFYEPEGRLRLTVEDRSYLEVRPRYIAPRSHPDKFVSLLDAKGKEIMLIDDPKSIGEENFAALSKELKLVYLTSLVTEVQEIRIEYGATYWKVMTERGERSFVTQSLQENAQWINKDFLLLIDVEGNHYHLRDISKMDAKSQKLINLTV